MTTGATFKRGKSKQDYVTPDDFMEAVKRQYGKIAFDLAADITNAKADLYFTKAEDALTKNWHKIDGWLWLNPPFSNIAPWAEKCLRESLKGAQILLLVPAAVGSNWFRDYVHKKAWVRFLNGRLHFDTLHPAWGYPKDCMLCEYTEQPIGYEVWKWK